MDAQELYQRFRAFSAAANAELQAGQFGASCLDRSLSDAVFHLEEGGFQIFWERIRWDDALRRRWEDRLGRGFAQEKDRLREAWDAESAGEAEPNAPASPVRGAA
jgi:hypothetical protein